MKSISTAILCFIVGFWGSSIIWDEPDRMLSNYVWMFFAILVATILKVYEDIRNKRK